MPSFSDSIFLFILALLLFGPKKLPVLARELGKWVGEFRRASNEFKMQMEEELRASEQEDRRKQIAAMEAAAPVAPTVDEATEPEHPHLRPVETPALPYPEADTDIAASSTAYPGEEPVHAESLPETQPTAESQTVTTAEPLPIATAGELRMMPPSTGLPTPRGRSFEPETSSGNALDTLVASIPSRDSGNGDVHLNGTESTAHGH